MGTFGHKVFEPLVRNAPLNSLVNDTDIEEQLFYIRRSGADAKSKLTNEGVVVLTGSIIRKQLVPSCRDHIKASREENKENIDENSILLNDILFKSPSGASSFVLGAPTNGNIEWKTDKGKTLKEVDV